MMAIIKFITKNHPNSKFQKKYHDYDVYYDLLNYIRNFDKTKGYFGCWALEQRYAARQMTLLTKLYHNDTGIKLRHWVISFTHSDIGNMCYKMNRSMPEALDYMGFKLTSFYKDRYQIVFGVHWVNEEQPHIHIAMNTTSYIDGKKFHGDRNDFYAYQKFVKNILAQYRVPVFVASDHTSSKCYT